MPFVRLFWVFANQHHFPAQLEGFAEDTSLISTYDSENNYKHHNLNYIDKQNRFNCE